MMKSCTNGPYMPLFKILTHPSLSLPCNPSPKKPRTGLPDAKGGVRRHMREKGDGGERRIGRRRERREDSTEARPSASFLRGLRDGISKEGLRRKWKRAVLPLFFPSRDHQHLYIQRQIIHPKTLFISTVPIPNLSLD